MIELLTLGALDLRRRDGPELRSVLAQPKRTALLVYLALARPRGFHRRDTLLGLFWPEHDTEHARNNLRQAIHFLRRSLGAAAIVSRGDEEVGLGEGVLGCDAVRFEALLEAGALEEALGLYGGDLLPGFFADDAAEFERWLEGERTRLRERAVRACWSLAESSERAGDTAGAAEWGRRAVEIAPADDTQIMRLMQLLARAGDRSGALASFEAHARRLRTQLEVEPTEAAAALAEEIRSAQPEQPARAESPPIPPTVAAAAAVTSPSPASADAPAAPIVPARSRSGGKARGLLLSSGAGALLGVPIALLAIGVGHAVRPDLVPLVEARLLAAAAGLVLVEAALLWRNRERRAPRGGAGVGFMLGVLVTLSAAFTLAPRPTPQAAAVAHAGGKGAARVAVAHFANLTGDPALDPVGRLAEEWVLRHLRAIPEAEVVTVTGGAPADTSAAALAALARRTGADLVLVGSFYRDGDELLLSASLVPARGSRIPAQITGMGIGPVRAPLARPADGVNRLASLVAGAVASGCRLPACVPGRRAPMYEARELYLEGYDAETRGNIDGARQKYRQASRLDSTFVNAYTHLAELSPCTERDSIGEILERRREDFGLYDLLYMRIIRARCRNDGEAIYRLRRQQLQIAPDNQDTRAGVAHAALLSGRLREAEARYRARLYETVGAPTPDESDFSRLAFVLHLQGRVEDELRVAADGRHRRPDDPRIPYLDLRGLAALARTQEIESRIEEARRTGSDLQMVSWLYYACAMELEWHGHTAAAQPFMLGALRELDRASSAERADARYVTLRAHVLLALGRWAEARRLLAAGDAQNAMLVTLRALAAAGAGDVAAARAALITLERLPGAVFEGETTRELLQAGVLAALGDRDAALRRLEDGQARNTLPRSGPYLTHAVGFATPLSGDLLRPLWHDARFERMFAARD